MPPSNPHKPARQARALARALDAPRVYDYLQPMQPSPCSSPCSQASFGVCDDVDPCPDGDDLIDTDGDGIPDACDACPRDNPDDSNGNGICDRGKTARETNMNQDCS